MPHYPSATAIDSGGCAVHRRGATAASNTSPDRLLRVCHVRLPPPTGRFKLPKVPGMRLGDMFASIEAAKQPYNIDEYSLSQTSLEQIFNEFAAQQVRHR